MGFFTDSDLARLLENRNDSALDQSIESRMTKHPLTTLSGTLLSEAVAIMSHRKISELPVVDHDGSPVGLLDITDVVALGDDVDQQACIPFESSPSRLRLKS